MSLNPVILLFCYYLSITKGVNLQSLLESFSSKDTLYHMWLKLAKYFWKRSFLKINNVFLLICYYFPRTYLTKFNSFYKRMFCARCSFDLEIKVIKCCQFLLLSSLRTLLGLQLTNLNHHYRDIFLI